MKRKQSAALILAAAVAVLALAASAGAVDGTIEINQAKVIAAGGFPYKITAPGSYRLTSNLTVVAASTDAIDVNSPNVTIDLNGFMIIGPGAASAGTGISAASASQVKVENGTVTQFNTGVLLKNNSVVREVLANNDRSGISTGIDSLVEGSTANSNTLDGIDCSASCTISGNTANGNSEFGISCVGNSCAISGNTATGNNSGIVCANGCLISGNTANANGNDGIICNSSGCLFSGNTALNNVGDGLLANDGTTGCVGNVATNNGTKDIFGCTSTKTNFCSGIVC